VLLVSLCLCKDVEGKDIASFKCNVCEKSHGAMYLRTLV